MAALTDESRAVIDDLILRYLEPEERDWMFADNIATGIEMDVFDRLGEWPGPRIPYPVATVAGRLSALRRRGLVESRGFHDSQKLVAEWRKVRDGS